MKKKKEGGTGVGLTSNLNLMQQSDVRTKGLAALCVFFFQIGVSIVTALIVRVVEDTYSHRH